MATYTDERNWDQKELDRARELARENVASDGATVPQASRLNAAKQDQEEGKAQPSPVLEGERPTTEDERETVEAQGVGGVIPSNGHNGDFEDNSEAGKVNFEQNAKEDDNQAKETKKSK